MFILPSTLNHQTITNISQRNDAWADGTVCTLGASAWVRRSDCWCEIFDGQMLRDNGGAVYQLHAGTLYALGGGGGPGPQGEQGERGEIGPQGLPGVDGDDGAAGAPGQNGSNGSQGIQGIPGPANLILGRVAADIPQSSNVAFSNLFTQAVLANEVWSFEAIIFYTSAAATTGIVCQVDTPASPTASQCSMFTQTTATASLFLPAAANAVMTGTAALISPTVNTARVVGLVENGANAGNLVVKFRSEVNASAITVKRGSHVRWFKH